MHNIVVTTEALSFSADRLGDAADATESLRLHAPLGEVPAAMPGSESAVAANLASAAWKEHATGWTKQARAQVEAMRAASLTYRQADSDFRAILPPAPETAF